VKVLRIAVILLATVMISQAGDLPKSTRQIYIDNKRIESEGIHTTRPIRPHNKRKRVFIYKCIDSETGEEVPCPEREKEEDTTERTYME